MVAKLTNPPLLAYPDYAKEFIVTTDASTSGIGAVLSQRHEDGERPIAYYSRSLMGAEKNYPIFHLEGLAIKAALQKWRFHLLGYKVLVRSDNQPIINILRSKQTEGRLSKYLSVIMEYQVRFQYLPGPSNKAADYLSRAHESDKESDENARVAKITIPPQSEEIHIRKLNSKSLPSSLDLASAQQQDKELTDLINRPSRQFRYV